MGLSVVVGIFADLEDEEGSEYFAQQFAAINQALRSANLPEHSEPDADASNIAPFSADMYGYSGLHYLRRIAAYIAANKGLPPPGEVKPSKDKVAEDYYADWEKPQGFLQKAKQLLSGPKQFTHLMLHSDAEGFYLPIQFDEVLFPEGSLEIAGGMIGSSFRLKEECELLAEVLGLPLSLNPEDEAIYEAAENQGKGEGWRKYGIESYTCLNLYHACGASIKSGCAIVFT